MRILIACEFSGRVRDAFARQGFDAWSCDLLPTDAPGQHIQADVLKVIAWGGWDAMIAHPPCTYLARSGWHWVNKPDSSMLPLKGEPRRRAAFQASGFFRALLNAPIAHIAIENPKPICHVGLPKATQSIQPWQHGHAEPKETMLWLVGFPLLVPSQVVPCGPSRIHRMSPGPTRSKERSVTYQGIANAMADQWGTYLRGLYESQSSTQPQAATAMNGSAT